MTDRNIAPIVTDFPHLSLPPMRVITTSHGAKLHILDHSSHPVTTLTLRVVGGKLDTSQAVALATMTALREGTDTMSGDEIEYALDFNGATLKADALSHHSVVTLSALSDKLIDMLPLFREIIVTPSYPADRVANQMEQIAAGRRIELERIAVIADHEATRLIAGADHPLTHQPLPDDFLAATPEQLTAWHRQIINPSTLNAYLTGPLSESDIAAVIDFLDSIPSLAEQALTPTIYPFKPAASQRVNKRHEGSMQSAVNIAIPTITRDHPEYAALRIATYALGGYMGSRLMSNIREERGLTYGISANLLGYDEGGYISIASQTRNDTVDLLIEQTNIEIRRLATEPPTGAELHNIRTCYTSSLAAILDSPYAVANYHMSPSTTYDPGAYFTTQIDTISSITPDQIATVAQKYMLTDDERIVVVGA